MTVSNQSYLKTSFGSEFDMKVFLLDLNNSSFATKIRGVTNATVQAIVVVENITAGEISELDDIVANHEPMDLSGRNNFYIISIDKKTTKNSNYTTVASFNYGGSNHVGHINFIDILAKSTNQGTAYDIRIYDSTNDQIMAEKSNLSNTNFENIDMGTISNTSATNAILEVHVRRSGKNKNIIINQITVYYD